MQLKSVKDEIPFSLNMKRSFLIVCSLKLAQDDVVVSGCLGGKGTVVRLLVIKLM